MLCRQVMLPKCVELAEVAEKPSIEFGVSYIPGVFFGIRQGSRGVRLSQCSSPGPKDIPHRRRQCNRLIVDIIMSLFR